MKRMKKIFASIFLSAAVLVSGALSIAASATNVKDVKIDCKDAKKASTWGKSLSVPKDTFNIARITEDTQIIVTFEYEDPTQAESAATSPVGLALQSFSDPDNALADEKGSVWAEVKPTTYDESSAIFYYQDILRAYTSKDFGKIDYLHIIAPSTAVIKCTSVTITDCNDKAPETTTTTTAAEESAAEETTAAQTTTETVQTTVQKNNASSSDNTGSSPIFLIIGIVSGIVLAVAVVIIIMNKKSSKAFDVSTGEFVSKKKLSKKKK